MFNKKLQFRNSLLLKNGELFSQINSLVFTEEKGFPQAKFYTLAGNFGSSRLENVNEKIGEFFTKAKDHRSYYKVVGVLPFKFQVDKVIAIENGILMQDGNIYADVLSVTIKEKLRLVDIEPYYYAEIVTKKYGTITTGKISAYNDYFEIFVDGHQYKVVEEVAFNL